MIVSRLRTAPNYHALVTSKEGLLSLNKVEHNPLSNEWVPISVDVYKSFDTYSIADFVHAPYGIACSDNARRILSPYISSSIEFLPFTCIEGKFYLLHVIEIVSCLDHHLSEFEYFPSGNLRRISRHVFDRECLGDKLLFVIPERTDIYATGKFSELVDRHNLTGLRFQQVWEG